MEQLITKEVLRDKYLGPNEHSADDVRRRVARALDSVEADDWQGRFFDVQVRGLIMGGRINASAGRETDTTCINCFVQPIGDSISGVDERGLPGIYVALLEAAETMRRGGGVGYDFSTIRPKGAVVRSTRSIASGPVSFMKVFDSSCATVISAGTRRGAQMAMLRINHPDIEKFISAKAEGNQLANFNCSVAVTDRFMEAVANDDTVNLVHPVAPSNGPGTRDTDGQYIYGSRSAREIWDRIMRSAYAVGEPGIVFLDRVNEENNLHYCENITACNPCAEQPLPAYGCCCLASINLAKFVHSSSEGSPKFAVEDFAGIIPASVRMLDDVLEITSWPLEHQRLEAIRKRRIGLGITGLGSTLAMLGIPYDSPEARLFARKILRILRDEAYAASVDLAIEKGSFPQFVRQEYLASRFVGRLPPKLQERIARHGIRNSHLISIAPTGSTSIAFGNNVSNGIEPVYALEYERLTRMVGGTYEGYTVYDYAYASRLDAISEGVRNGSFRTALQLSAHSHVEMLTALQEFADAAISKTVNIRSDYDYDDFRDLYSFAWANGAKSVSTFREHSPLGHVLSASGSKAATGECRTC